MTYTPGQSSKEDTMPPQCVCCKKFMSKEYIQVWRSLWCAHCMDGNCTKCTSGPTLREAEAIIQARATIMAAKGDA